MAKQQILVSDLSGAPIPNGEAVKVSISTGNGKRYELDAAISEVSELIENAREGKRRGRPPKK